MNGLVQSATSLAKHSALREPLPEAWIDRLFSRFHAMYGNKFAAMWEGTNPHDVKAVWAEELAGFRDMPHCIKHALDACMDSDWPPSLPTFVKSCREAAKRHTPASLALGHQLTEDELEERRQMLHDLAASFNKLRP